MLMNLEPDDAANNADENEKTAIGMQPSNADRISKTQRFRRERRHSTLPDKNVLHHSLMTRNSLYLQRAKQ